MGQEFLDTVSSVLVLLIHKFQIEPVTRSALLPIAGSV